MIKLNQMKLKIGVLAAGILIVSLPFALRAQENNSATSSSTVSTPNIFITNLFLNNDTVAKNGSLSGRFDILNKGNAASSDIYYDIILAGKYYNRIPRETYDTSRRGPLTLAAGERKTVSFSYNLPEGFSSNDIGLRVQAVLKSGIHMGWADVPLKMTGTSTLLQIRNFALVVGGKDFIPNSGPTVYKDQAVYYRATLDNDSKGPVSVSPAVTVYKYGSSDQPVYEQKGDPVSINSASSTDVKVNLPDMGRKAGVYYGNLKFVDKNGNSKTPVLIFRYIIDGKIATLQGVVADKTNVKEGEEINLKVTYTGAPINIDNGTRSEVGMLNLSVVAFDQHGNEIGRNQKDVDASQSVQTTEISIPVKNEATELRFEAVLEKDGEIVSQYASNVISDGKNIPAEDIKNTYAVYLGIASAGLLVLLALISLWAKLSGKNKHIPHYPSGLGMITFAVMFLSGTLYVSQKDVTNAFLYQSSDPANFRPLFINLPYDNQEFMPSQRFYLDGSATFLECDNGNYGARTLSVVYDGQTSNFTVGEPMPSTASSSPYSTGVDYTDYFSVGPFTAPAAEGTYRMTITYGLPNEGNPVYTETVYVDTVVSTSANHGNDPVTLSPSATQAPCGGYVALNWTAMNNATQYTLYRDGSAVYSGTGLSYIDTVVPNSSHQYFVIPVVGGAQQDQSNLVSIQGSTFCPLNAYYIEAVPNPAIVNQDVTWAVWVTGGSGVYNYTWTGDEGLNDTSGRVVHKRYAYTGPKNATVSVHSTDGQTVNLNSSVSVWSWNGFSSLDCYASPIEAIVGKPVTWTVIPDPPNSGYNYLWTGSDGLYGTTQSVQKTYSTLGLKHAQVDVTGIGSQPDCVTEINVKWKSIFEEL